MLSPFCDTDDDITKVQYKYTLDNRTSGRYFGFGDTVSMTLQHSSTLNYNTYLVIVYYSLYFVFRYYLIDVI